MLNRAKTIDKLAGHGQRSIAVNMTLGVVAGAARVWAIDRIRWFMYSHKDRGALSQKLRTRKGGNCVGYTSAEEAARQRQAQPAPAGKDVAHVDVEKAQRLAGVNVRTGQPNPAGIVVHYGLGLLPGAVHGVLRGKVPTVRAGGGALYGLGPFAVMDETVAPAGTGLRAEAVSMAGPRQGPGGPYGAGRGHRHCVALISTVPGNRAQAWAGTIVRSMMGTS